MFSIKNGEYTYRYEDYLGGGAFGQVYQCRSRTELFALKVVNKQRLADQGDYLVKALHREIEVQRAVSASALPFFVRLFDSFQDEANIYLVLEYCESSLTTLLRTRPLDEPAALEIVYQVGLGLAHMHQLGLTHRDVKLDNILLKGKTLKIADFGFATAARSLMTHLGTPCYMSPEFFAQRGLAYSSKVDVWALNTALYRLLTKEYFFFEPRLRDKVLRLPFELPAVHAARVSPLTRELLAWGYEKDPTRRPSMAQYLSHFAFARLAPPYARYLQQLGVAPATLAVPPLAPLSSVPPVLEAFLRFRNSCLLYTKLANFVFLAQLSYPLALQLIKRHVQLLGAVFFAFCGGLPPALPHFAAVPLGDEAWRALRGAPGFLRLMKLYKDELFALHAYYKQRFAAARRAKDNVALPPFDLNQDVSEVLLGFAEAADCPAVERAVGAAVFRELREQLRQLRTLERDDAQCACR